MTAATQSFMSSAGFSPANMFARNNHGHPVFKNSFGTRTIEPAETEKSAPQGLGLDALNTHESSFFDFEPPSGGQSPYPNRLPTPVPSGLSWINDHNLQPLSPPDSATLPSKEWPFSSPYQLPPPNILTNIDPSQARAHYGQVTPPDDNDKFFANEDKSEVSEKKRKRNTTDETQAGTTAKRTRKYASRNGKAGEQKRPEDAKRSKFLERNRVAASKCRQKKKEWTQDLENRARDLQKQNNSLRLVIESLKQESLFLKGEALKHHSCGCRRIQEYVESGRLAKFDADDFIKQERSPLQPAPCSPTTEQNSPKVEPLSDNALEALLTSSIDHDTSDEGTAIQVGC